MADENELTIYDAIDRTKVQEAITNLLNGKTPLDCIKERDGRGGTRLRYVETYYIIDQLNKLFAFKWNFEVISEVADASEIIVKGKLTAFTKDYFPIIKEQFGQVDRLKGVPLGDQKKAAASDCLKKCASLFGIALDVYWGKEIEYFSPENEDADFSSSQAAIQFGKHLSKHHIPVSKALQILGIGSLKEITDYKVAYDKINEELDK